MGARARDIISAQIGIIKFNHIDTRAVCKLCVYAFHNMYIIPALVDQSCRYRY